MKKRICLLLAVLLCLLSGCSDPYAELTEEYNLETDYPTSFFEGSLGPFVTPAPGGYYAFVGQYLHFIDAETNETVVLCNRPECRHMNETDSERAAQCLGYFAVDATPFLQYYEGNVYVGSRYFADAKETSPRYALVRVAADGSNREYLCQLDTGQYTSYAIHRGYLYSFSVDTDNRTRTLRRKSMKNLRGESEILFQQETVNSSFRPLFYGSKLYFPQIEAIDSQTFRNQIIVFDLNSGKSEPLFAEDHTGASQYIVFGVYNGELLLAKSTSSNGVLYELYNPDTQSFTTIAEYQQDMSWEDDGESIMTNLRTDGEMLYRYVIRQTDSSSGFALSFVDENSEAFLPSFESDTLPRHVAFCPGDNKCTFVYGFDREWNLTLGMIDKEKDRSQFVELVHYTEQQAFPNLNYPIVPELDY